MKHKDFAQVIDEFSTTTDDLKQIAACVRYDIEKGLANEATSLRMLNSYIGLPDGSEKGDYLSIDFGGTNLRVGLVRLNGNGNFTIEKKLAKPLKVPGKYDYTSSTATAKALFSFIASLIKELIGSSTKKYYLGHTFSFPSTQTNIYNAKLIKWTKEFATRDVEGKIINDLLKDALHEQQLDNVEPIAIINDTVAVLLAAAYTSSNTYIGSIYATGHNTCYFESNNKYIKKPTIINLEIGNFDKLSLNDYDKALDAASVAPYEQRLEKMVAGRYIGELFAYCLQDLFGLATLPVFSSIDLSVILEDESPNRTATKQLIKDHLQVDLSDDEALAINRLADAITARSARLAAASYCGILWHIFPHGQPEHRIFIDGSLFQNVPNVTTNMQQALNEILAEDAAKITLESSKGGSILGAAVAAAMNQ